ncbi:MAG: adenylate/guanylate cyclase domain-containing protein [Vulcanimicrobiaceae bacterium]
MTAKDAPAAIEAGNVDLMLLDLVGSSAEIFNALRAAVPRAAAIVPVIVTAPLGAVDRIVACLARGAEESLITPFDAQNPILVERRVALALERARLRSLRDRVQRATSDPNATAFLELHNHASSRFVPREFLDHLNRETLTDVKLGDHVQRDMTVFFCDIRDFTTLSEQLTPQQNFDFLNSYLGRMTPIIRAHHGFVDKYIGDAIMALFARTPGDALEAAVEVLRAVSRYNEGRSNAGYVAINIGIGLHRGDLILGTIGEEERMQTTVIADAVNVASRIEGLTKTFGVPLLVSGSVAGPLPDDHSFKLRPLGAVKTKGRTKSVEIYECFDADDEGLVRHKLRTSEQFGKGIAEFRKGMFLTAGRIFARIAEMDQRDTPAAYFRDACTLTAVHERGRGPWDGAERIEVK